MRKIFWAILIIIVFLVTLGSVTVLALQAADFGLSLVSPAACPTSGCAAGQRLNFSMAFSVDPQFTESANTQICIYAPEVGQSGGGEETWADFSKGWITENDIYTAGQVNSICTDAAPSGDTYVVGVYATHKNPLEDQINFALHINRTSDINGHVSAKIFQVDSNGTTWKETTEPAEAFVVPISVAPIKQIAYAAEIPSNCGAFAPCFVHSGDDNVEGQGTSLYDAIQALEAGGEITILKDLRLKSNTVLVNKNLTIKGYDQNSMLTSINTEKACSEAMLRVESAVVLKGLTINDGNCPASSSRTLIEINSKNNATVQNCTLNSGNYGIHILNNTGRVEIAFNQIANNQDKAILVDTGSSDHGRVNIYANNIFNNGNPIQVNCNDGGIADHNFWGESQLASKNTASCITSSGKELGAPILSATDGHGVQGIIKTVTDSFKYFFNGNIGVRHTEGGDYQVVIVNHGQGTDNNIPFLETGSGYIQPCGNFYDIFLSDDADPKNLQLALKYDLNDYCINTIESDYYCGNANQARYPLWWYDPVNQTTNGWDRTGQLPEGPGGGGESGQVTSCHTQLDEIIVSIDNTGRPGIISDLNFTPFTTGYIEGAALTDFSVEFINFYARISWQTSMEKNVKRYEIYRSKQKDDAYQLISSITINDDSTTPTTYQFYDYYAELSTTYYYKLQVIHNSVDDEIIGIHGPVTLQVPGPTVTNTPTITRTPYPSSTPIYRTPTRDYRQSATPGSAPTPVRTYRPTPTGGTEPANDPTLTSTPGRATGYPAGETSTPTAPAYPANKMTDVAAITPSPTIIVEKTSEMPTPSEETLQPTQIIDEDQDSDEFEQRTPRWYHWLIGLVSGIGVLFIISFSISKSFYS